jgi:DNA-binding CsgD family transcriptional regulator
VFVHKAAVGGLLPLEATARQFRLSAAELRVLAVVIEVGGSVPEIAEALGVSEPTVKSHLRRLFDKTGTRRQADLVRLVAGYSNPLIGQPDKKPHPSM